jgi:hypothetical protein
MCGFTEIDGHTLCLGLGFACTTFKEVMAQVTFLIQGARIRPRSMSQKEETLSLNISSLGELLDMYHTHKAAKRHDKVYALLSMCSDNPSTAGLGPDYRLPWKDLMQRVVKFILANHVFVDTWNENEIAIIKSKGCVIGKVDMVTVSSTSGGGQDVVAIVNTSFGCGISGSAHWSLQTSAKSIQKGDVICLLQGVSKPTIVRLQDDYLAIIIIAAVPPKHIRTIDGDVEWLTLVKSASFFRDFILVWDWEAQDSNRYDALMRENNAERQHAKTNLEIDMDYAIRAWNVAQILGDLEAFNEAEERRQRAADSFQVVVKEKHAHSLECRCSRAPLLWAAESGEDAVVGMLLTKDDVDPDLKDYSGRTPLWWAAWRGHEGVVKLLLDTGKVNADPKDDVGRTPLWWAARNGHEAMVKLLLDTDKVNVDAKDGSGGTPLSWAIKNGHEAVVKLLETAKVKADAKDCSGGPPEPGYRAVVKRRRQVTWRLRPSLQILASRRK